LVFAELKVARAKPTPAQTRWLARLGVVAEAGDGVDVYVWRPEDWSNGTIEARLK